MASKLFVPKEHAPGETRVAATPETVKRLIKLGFEVAVEAGAGAAAHIADKAFTDAGATIAADAKAAWAGADVVIKIGPPLQNPKLGADEATLLKEGAILVCHIWANTHGRRSTTIR
jgi:NAD(P) transhydrogenase subunit alpha